MKKIIFTVMMAAMLLTACGSAENGASVTETSVTSSEPAMQPVTTEAAGTTETPSTAEAPSTAEVPSEETAMAEDTDSTGGNVSGNYIIITKSARSLVLYDGSGNVIKTYKVGLAQNPVGAKEKAGDKKTPEGSYYVCVKNAASKFHKALGLSYPNSDDAARGLQAGLITEAEKEAIDAAITAGGRPDWNTALGGEIMIHGQKGDMGSQLDWTTGCVAVNNEDIDDLWNYTEVGTKVTILP